MPLLACRSYIARRPARDTPFTKHAHTQGVDATTAPKRLPGSVGGAGGAVAAEGVDEIGNSFEGEGEGEEE